MKNFTKFLTLWLFAGMLGITGFSQSYVEIGDGTSLYNYPGYYFPFYHAYNYDCNRSQQLYLQSEIGGAQTFTHIGFNIGALGNNASFNDFTIRVLHTTATSLSGGSNAFIDMSTATTVYETGTINSPTSTGWWMIDVTDFAYNGTDNLLIEIEWNNNGYNPTYFRNHKTLGTVNRSLYVYGYNPYTSGWVQVSTYYSNLRLYFTPTEPMLSVNPNPHSFGNVETGTCSADQTFTAANVGIGTINISSISITGADASEFVLTDGNTYPIALTTNTATVDVQFCPTTDGSKSANLTIVDDLTKQTTDIPLSGTGYTPPPGDNCTDAVELTGATGTHSSAVTYLNNDFSTCSMSNVDDWIGYYDVPDGGYIEFWLTNTSPSITYRYTLRYGGTCPGDNEAACDYGTTNEILAWENTTGATTRVWYIVSEYYHNFYLEEFTVNWQYYPPGTAAFAPYQPYPANGATGRPVDGSVSWMWGMFSDTYDIWFGPAGNMTQVVTGGTVSGVSGSYTYSGLNYLTNYEWQVIVYNSIGTQTDGPVWNFTTDDPPPANDLCLNAEVVTCGTYTGTTYQATNDNMPDCENVWNNRPGVWYVYTGTGTMVSADLCTGTSWDTRMNIYTGTCGALVCYDANDDTPYCGNYASRVDWFAETGVDYYILVHQYGTSGGAFTLTIDCTDPATATWWGGQVMNNDNDWLSAANWNIGDVPGATTDVTIPADLYTSSYPTLDRPGTCRDITLESNADWGTATLLDAGYLTVNGTANVQRYFSGNDVDWHLVSSPISNATSGVFLDMYLQSFNETTNSYDEITGVNDPLNVMQGYALFSTLGTDNTVTFSGDLNFGDQSNGFTANNLGWNLFGNPYPSSVDWNDVTIPAGMSNEVHYIRASDGNDLSYVQGSGGTGSQFIPPMQGFFVSATAVGTFTIADLARDHSNADNFYKDYNPTLVRLMASGENFSDETLIHFNESAEVEHDGQFDAYKRISISNPELPQIFSITPSGTNLSVNGLPETSQVPIGFTAVESGVFTISTVETGDFTELYLEDLFTGTITNLLNDSYTISYSSDDQDNRFVLHYGALSVNESLAGSINIFSTNKDVYVNVPEKTQGEIKVYNITGQEVVSTVINNTPTVISLQESGYYVVVVVISNETTVSEKVFIK